MTAGSCVFLHLHPAFFFLLYIDRSGKALSRAALSIHAHNGPVYGARFDPFNPFVLATFSEFSSPRARSLGDGGGDASGSGDPYLKVWDLRMLYRRVGVQKLAPPLFSVRLDQPEEHWEDSRHLHPVRSHHHHQQPQVTSATGGGTRDGRGWWSSATSGAQKQGQGATRPSGTTSSAIPSSAVGGLPPSSAVAAAFSRGAGGSLHSVQQAESLFSHDGPSILR